MKAFQMTKFIQIFVFLGALFFIKISFSAKKESELENVCRTKKIFGRQNKARIYFAKNKGKISAQDRLAIKKKIIIPILEHQKNIEQVVIVGHTSATGSSLQNQRLSKTRANLLRSILVKNGVSSRIVVTRGLGESQLLYLGNSPEDHSRNRRVELFVNFKESCYETTP